MTDTPSRSITSLADEVDALLARLGVEPGRHKGGTLVARTPITGEITGRVHEVSAAQAAVEIDKAHAAFLEWRQVPAPKRGELVRLLGEELRANKEALGRLVSIEVGKIASEGLGEVQEMIDICDFAVGLARQLYGLTIATERSEHRMMEIWHPLGVTGIISAFNFPVAVWCWNAALALVCGNSIVWKPSEKTPLTALATEALFARALERFKQALESVREDMRNLSSKLATQLRKEERALFDVYLMMLDDASIGLEVKRIIRTGQWAQGALRQVVMEHVQRFELMDDAYLRERASDVKDIGRRILAYLQEERKQSLTYPDQTIIVSEELSPAMLGE
ncbi:MAG: aldehyde dehydrogenase family protein, partial [Bradyrhizobium sp.]|nr:aldehyde dehydrogenase family protein [Bradyrhizobium sp.]